MSADPSSQAKIGQRNWERTLAEMVAFIADHDRLPTRESSDEAERRLGVWLQRQRLYDRKGTLAQNRIDALTAAFDWRDWRRDLDRTWQRNFEALKDHVAAHGGLLPSNSRSAPEEVRALYHWWAKNMSHLEAVEAAGVADQRARDLREWLDALDQPPAPVRNRERVQRWSERLDDVRRFRAEHDGRLPSTTGSTDHERRTAFWLAHQRRALSHGRLSGPRQEALKEALS